MGLESLPVPNRAKVQADPRHNPDRVAPRCGGCRTTIRTSSGHEREVVADEEHQRAGGETEGGAGAPYACLSSVSSARSSRSGSSCC